MTIAIAIYLFILGLACGSFYNVVGLRVPAKQSVVHPPSHCTSCGTQLRRRDLVPVLSYVLSKGKCRHCGAGVSFVYPLGELLTGLLFAGMYLRFGFTLDMLMGLLLVSLSVIITVSDLKYQLIPNTILLAFLPFLAVLRVYHHDLPLWEYLLGALVGGGVIVLVILLSRGGMGLGDAKLLAVLGLVVGYKLILIALFLACLVGTLIGGPLLALRIVKRKQPIPFGPFLALGTLLAYCYGDQLLNSYLSLIS
ncbi:leader peptidase (prepilin peptidase)/N-methyltransferase [Paenibacillus phyllosphaerae]|uniref:Prepilin leader peptidase/N-methyltransferase n=1 Tax=Paenibacillus phyllosphaerae TaxID=274593 RepID=A0A7W5AU59_9BACL|nr:A24 family peptidase [Paenibacillus phyllosphaerae]MBB3108728.1 leader peptidase (prepilin peptidase)/N-methyltransferase [Paenibacillus phyllosphaerae]